MVHPSKWWSGSCKRQFSDLQWEDKRKPWGRRGVCCPSQTPGTPHYWLGLLDMCPVPDHHPINFLLKLINTYKWILFELLGLIKVPENKKPPASTKVCIPEEEDYGINNCKIVCLYAESNRKGQQVETKWPLDSWKRCHPSMREWSRSSRRKMDW